MKDHGTTDHRTKRLLPQITQMNTDGLTAKSTKSTEMFSAIFAISAVKTPASDNPQ